ncbi:MAG: helix-turn-helix domain-containing protein [Pseudonocardiaceae bacterium]
MGRCLLGWSPSWVSRLLSGKRGATELDVAAFLGVCRVKSPERERLIALCQEHTPGYPHSSSH